MRREKLWFHVILQGRNFGSGIGVSLSDSHQNPATVRPLARPAPYLSTGPVMLENHS